MLVKNFFKKTGYLFLIGVLILLKPAIVKKIVLAVALVLSFSACNNNGRVEGKADSLAKRLDTTLDKLADSARQKGGRLLDTLEKKFDNLRDSAKKE